MVCQLQGSNATFELPEINFADGKIILNRAQTSQLGNYGSFQIAQLLFLTRH